MKKRFLLTSFLWLLALSLTAQESIKILVLDSESESPIPNVHLVGSDFHGHTSLEGMVVVPGHLSAGDSLTFSYVGYEPQRYSVQELRQLVPAVVRLSFSSEALSELVVEHQAPNFSRATVGEMLSPQDLEVSLGNSLAESLQRVKGVSLLSSGVSGGKPVIHGMHGHRILIINNGIRQEGQQWGHDHAPEVDLSAAGVVSVLKGAEAVRYGSDALGGAIVVEQPPLPYGRKGVAGNLSHLFATNGRIWAFGSEIEGTFGQKNSWAWRLQANGLSSGDRSTAKYLLNNTGESQLNISLALGKKASRYEVDLYYSLVASKEGVFRGAQMGDIYLLQERIKIGQPVIVDPFSREVDYPYQRVQHQLIRAKGTYTISPRSQLSAQVALQHDRRREYQIRRANRSQFPNLSLTLNNIQADLGWEQKVSPKWLSHTGVHGSYSDNFNEAGTGVVPMIPNYVLLSGGLFSIQKYEQKRWGVEGGIRADYQYLNASGIDMYSRSYGGKHQHLNVTYTLGTYLQPTDALQIKSQLGTAWRAPHVAELYSEGLDHASGIYLRGDSTFTSERATKWIASLSYTRPKLKVSIEGYLQWIENYIYQEPTGEIKTVISGAYPLFQYRQVPATLHGVDAEITWRPLSWLEYTAQSGMIWAEERHTGRYLPYIPPLHFSQKVEFSLPWHGTKLALRHDFVARQHRFDPATDLIDFAPPAYHLFGIEGSSRIDLPWGHRLSLHLAVHNLLNKEYKEYTNRSRYYAHNLGRDVRLSLKYHF